MTRLDKSWVGGRAIIKIRFQSPEGAGLKTNKLSQPTGPPTMCKFNINVVSYTFCRRAPLPARVCVSA